MLRSNPLRSADRRRSGLPRERLLSLGSPRSRQYSGRAARTLSSATSPSTPPGQAALLYADPGASKSARSDLRAASLVSPSDHAESAANTDGLPGDPTARVG